MAKKKGGLDLGKILYAVAAVLGVVAVCMLFVEAVKVPDSKLGSLKIEGNGYSGAQVAFGYTNDSDVAILNFSFLALLPSLLALAGAVLSILKIALKKSSKLLDFVSIGCFVVAGILFFIMPNFMVFADNIVAKVIAEADFVLAIGSIVAAVCSLLAGAAVLVKNLLKK